MTSSETLFEGPDLYDFLEWLVDYEDDVGFYCYARDCALYQNGSVQLILSGREYHGGYLFQL